LAFIKIKIKAQYQIFPLGEICFPFIPNPVIVDSSMCDLFIYLFIFSGVCVCVFT